MSWNTVRIQFNALADACRQGDPVEVPWAEFKAAVMARASTPPVHLHTVLEQLKILERDRPRSEIAILDHGTGTGVNLLYLAALGYRELWGANVYPKAQPQNRVFSEVLGYESDRIFVYDGHRLPLLDGSIDLVVSQTVVEHLSQEVLGPYYAEEGRVLRPGGFAVHQVPHRLMPYDSHTCTWFVHYAPEFLQTLLYRYYGNTTEQVGKTLFLRSPGTHMQLARAQIGPTFDITDHRLKVPADLEVFDGPSSLRRVLNLAFPFPGLGAVFRRLVGPLMMLESISVKRAAP